ncbi:hypothetical protein SGPA1_41089 [Streptomyces misionensis JCM 4497]
MPWLRHGAHLRLATHGTGPRSLIRPDPNERPQSSGPSDGSRSTRTEDDQRPPPLLYAERHDRQRRADPDRATGAGGPAAVHQRTSPPARRRIRDGGRLRGGVSRRWGGSRPPGASEALPHRRDSGHQRPVRRVRQGHRACDRRRALRLLRRLPPRRRRGTGRSARQSRRYPVVDQRARRALALPGRAALRHRGPPQPPGRPRLLQRCDGIRPVGG